MRNTESSSLRATAMAALLVLVATAGALAGDPVVAKTLLDSGKKSFNAKKYEEAGTFFRKAYLEDPSLLECLYWTAQVHEKRKEDAEALASYRAFLSLLDKKGAAGGVGPEEQKLRPLAEKRVAALAVAETEFQKLEDRYADELLAFARAKLLRDPAVALKAVERVLEARPGDREAVSLRGKLSGAPGVAESRGAFPTVKEWLDLVHDQAFKGEGVTYTGDLLEWDTKTGKKLRSPQKMDLGNSFAYEVEFKVLDTFEEGWLAGLSIGETRDGFVAVVVQRAQVEVSYNKPLEKQTIVATFPMTPLDTAPWHRLGVGVKGDSVEVWLDGKVVLGKSMDARTDLAGEIGLCQQGCRVQRRVLRAGKM
jgi:tetratricopeptide (TPR) repeat protein